MLPLLGLAQIVSPVKDVTPFIKREYPQFKKKFGRHKSMPELFEKQILYALSYFPELTETTIHFRLNRSGIIATRPAWLSVLRRSGRRTYIVFINDAVNLKWSGFLLRHAGINGQVGIIGHELTHILNFEKRSTAGLLGIGVGHVSRRYMNNFENKTDSVCVERGLGYQLIDWNIFLRRAFGVADDAPDPFLKKSGRERYMSPASIRRLIGKSPVYRSLQEE